MRGEPDVIFTRSATYAGSPMSFSRGVRHWTCQLASECDVSFGVTPERMTKRLDMTMALRRSRSQPCRTPRLFDAEQRAGSHSAVRWSRHPSPHVALRGRLTPNNQLSSGNHDPHPSRAEMVFPWTRAPFRFQRLPRAWSHGVIAQLIRQGLGIHSRYVRAALVATMTKR